MASTLAVTMSPLSFPQPKSHFHNPITPPTQHNLRRQNTPYTQSPSTSPSSTTSNRHSLPNNNILWQQHKKQMDNRVPMIQTPSPPPSPTRPRLSLDTSHERLNATVVCKDDKSYLKLFSPVLVESPVSFLDSKQLFEDKKLWENGPDAAFQKQLDIEKRDTYKGKKKVKTVFAPQVPIWDLLFPSPMQRISLRLFLSLFFSRLRVSLHLLLLFSLFTDTPLPVVHLSCSFD